MQEQRFERVGGNETIQTDVRVIAATNKDLEAEVAAGRFRKDLFYRLNVFTIHLPPLRERRDDIPLLVEHFSACFSQDLGRAIRSVAPEAMERLQAYDWPGNVRQLQSVLKYALIQAPGDVLTLDCLPENLRSDLPTRPQPGEAHRVDFAAFTEALLRSGESDVYRRACQEMDRVVLDAVLRHVQGNQLRSRRAAGHFPHHAAREAAGLGHDRRTAPLLRPGSNGIARRSESGHWPDNGQRTAFNLSRFSHFSEKSQVARPSRRYILHNLPGAKPPSCVTRPNGEQAKEAGAHVLPTAVRARGLAPAGWMFVSRHGTHRRGRVRTDQPSFRPGSPGGGADPSRPPDANAASAPRCPPTFGRPR